MNVPLLDLKAQYRAIKKELDEALIRTAESQYFILGPEVEKMEQAFCKYLNCKHAVGVSSGTDALLLALMGIDLNPGDEVVVPTFSFFATAGVVSRLNAVPIFADSDPVTFNIAPSDIEHRITKKTRAIIPVHLYGQSADMDEIMKIAKRHNLIVIEDGAQAIGVQYKDGIKVGNIGQIGCFSFFPSKNLGCFGDGGLVTTNDDVLADKLRKLRVHGGHPKYYHSMIGGNFRIDAIQAAVLNVKLPFLDGWSAGRRRNADLYTSLFLKAGLAKTVGETVFDTDNAVLLPKAVYRDTGHPNHHIFNQFVIRVERRNALKEFLAKKNVVTEIYYPVPFHRQECFANLKPSRTEYPVADCCANDSLALPIYPELTPDQIAYVVDSVVEFQKSAASLPLECKHCDCMKIKH
jgi:dTDP-4-amino-4,6-dideoxygalactose transaminase